MAQSLQLGLCRDHLSGEVGRYIQHRPPFLLDVQRVVLAGELRKLIRGLVKIQLDSFETLLKKDPFAMRGRSRQLGDKQIQLVDVSGSDGSGTLRTAVCYIDRDDPALSI